MNIAERAIALDAYLDTLNIPVGVWSKFDRDAAADHLGVSRILLARIAARAESDGICRVSEDRIFILTAGERAEVVKAKTKGRRVKTLQEILAVVESALI